MTYSRRQIKYRAAQMATEEEDEIRKRIFKSPDANTNCAKDAICNLSASKGSLN
jgi:hypothetical protein